MNPNSRYSSEKRSAENVARLLCLPAHDGRDIVKLSREIIHAYSAAGLSIDDAEVENIVAIDSETDTMDLSSQDTLEELEHVYRIYKEVFEESRQKIRLRLAAIPGHDA
jgi:hypothetical protein